MPDQPTTANTPPAFLEVIVNSAGPYCWVDPSPECARFAAALLPLVESVNAILARAKPAVLPPATP